MRFINVIKVALRALRRNILRSVLTALGIIIGIAAVIAVVSIGNGAKTQVEAQIASLGQNIISDFPGNFTAGGVRGGFGPASTLTVEDATAIATEIAGVAAVSPEMNDRSQVLANGLNWNTQIRGEDKLRTINLGLFFTSALAREAVLTRNLSVYPVEVSDTELAEEIGHVLHSYLTLTRVSVPAGS